MALTPPPSVPCALFLISVLVNFCGSVVFMMLGLWFFESQRPFEPVFGHKFYTLCICLFVAWTAAICVLSFLGAAAVLGAKRGLILLYGALVALCGIAMGATGVASLYFHDQVRQIVNVSLNQSMALYYGMAGFQGLTSSIDFLQESMPCCGYILYNDWVNADLYRYQTERTGVSVPLSCCRPEHRLDSNPACNAGFPFPVSPGKLYPKGCLPLLESWYREHSYIIGVVASAISAFLFVTFCASMHHFREVSNRTKLAAVLKGYQKQRG